MVTERSRQAADLNTGTLLLRAVQAFQVELLQGLGREGYDLRAKHGAVLANLDPDGSRLTVLARRARMGKPALGELVDELQAMGYVQRVPDPADGRARLVLPTARGLAAIEAARRLIGAIERRYAAELGESLYASLREALLTLVPHGSEDLQPRT